MPTPPSPRIAILGSGPSGCYLAQSLLRALPASSITIFDRLVSPFGLIRYGVAADHQHTKAITRQFDRLFQSDSVRFAGGVEVGRDVSLEQLRSQFDAVVLATGLSADRGLNVPGADQPQVVGSGEITRTLNSHPDEGDELPDFGSDVVIIGAGNVALDLLRFLVKGEADYAGSDISETALHSYLQSPAERITIVSRSDAPHSKGDPQMIKELAALERASYTTPDEVNAPGDTPLDRTGAARVAAFTELFSPERPIQPGPQVTVRFGLTPLRVIGTGQVEAIELGFGGTSGSTAETVTIPATAVITAIGFEGVSSTAGLLPLIASPSETGRVEPGLYRTGWAKRGPRGAIPENRACAKAVSDELVADIQSGTLTADPAKLGFEGLPLAVRERAIGYAEWLALDTHERENAQTDRVRRKLPNHTHMAEIARGLTASV